MIELTRKSRRVIPQREFRKVWRLAWQEPSHFSLAELLTMSKSRDPRVRLKALFLMRKQLRNGRPRRYLALAKRLVADPDKNCRWQALIVVGEFIRSNPEAVWKVICRRGVSADKDMRAGVATVLLEHLLEHHFSSFFPRVRTRVKKGSWRLADTLSSCLPFGRAKSRWHEVKALLQERRLALRS